ncbi:MAG: hypothetical protein AAFX08_01490 [Pseudomonadota bacterium]
MSEFELVQIVENTIAQIILIIGQLIAINSAVIVAAYYFLNQARVGIKIAAFLIYSLGALMYFLFAVRESNVNTGAARALLAIPENERSSTAAAILEFADSPANLVLNIATNFSVFFLWVVAFYVVFLWRKKPDGRDVVPGGGRS